MSTTVIAHIKKENEAEARRFDTFSSVRIAPSAGAFCYDFTLILPEGVPHRYAEDIAAAITAAINWKRDAGALVEEVE